jgi:dihydroflavonol-4-reductase
MLAITGSSGLLGSSLVSDCISRNIPFRALMRGRRRSVITRLGVNDSSIHEVDILDMPGLLNAFDGASVVVHCAARVSFAPGDRDKIYSVNVEGTHNVVNACLAQRVPRLIHISSVAAFGRQKNVRSINEGTQWTNEIEQTHYGKSKHLAELEVYRGMEEGLQVTMINPSVILAAGDGIRSSSRFFGYAWRERLLYTDFPVNYVDARDVTEMIFRVMDKSGNGEKYIANAGQVTVGSLLRNIAERVNKRPPRFKVSNGMLNAVVFAEYVRHLLTGAKPGLTRQSLMLLKESVMYDNTKASTELGMKFRSLDETLDWCCAEFLNFTTNK